VAVVSALITAVVFVVVAIGGFSGRSLAPAPTHHPGSTTSLGASTTAPAAAAQLALAALDGIPQSGTRLGDPSAPVRITVFGDLECQVCRTFILGTAFRGLVTDQVRPGRASIDFRSFCTSTCSGRSKSMFDAQQIAAYAAGEQHRFWGYALLFLAEQRAGAGYATSAYLEELARQLPGLSLAHWQTARATPALLARLRRDAVIARADHVVATPTMVVTRATAHVTLLGDVTYRQLVSAIDRVQRAPAVTVNPVVKQCLSTGHLTRRYSKAQLRGALKSMSASVKQYSNCADVISRALAGVR
jgi:protein-disulfide isomerase